MIITQLKVTAEDEKRVKNTANKLYKSLATSNNEWFIFKPMPSPINKINNKFRWRIIIKCKLKNSTITKINNSLNSLGENKCTIIVEENPYNMS